MSHSKPDALLRPEALYPEAAGTAAYQLIDVRAPTEFMRGALPFSHNRPILSDAERHLVGIRYREAGPDEAFVLGQTLTAADMPERVAAWRALCREGPTAVCCWRGGMRSRLAQDYIGAERVQRVVGGYKALRRYVMGRLEPILATKQTLVVGGLTGTGKTALLGRIALSVPQVFVLDLEAEAKHRGSAFGGLDVPQPSQASFENALATKLLLSVPRWLVLEDEARLVGRLSLPDALYTAVQTSPLVLLEAPLEERVARIFEDYVRQPSETAGADATREGLEHNLGRLQKRLSGSAYTACRAALDEAARGGGWLEPGAHTPWITTLLTDYYDPRYRQALANSGRPVAFRGDYEECARWIDMQTS
ncbi:MAG: tRNA 2-selenouridine(34) synthase MnmH [Trueperaceae bacterium]|nr:tRNA 2-selenouridine(34) synthase MnmH [Trueperaceae bacterium]